MRPTTVYDSCNCGVQYVVHSTLYSRSVEVLQNRKFCTLASREKWESRPKRTFDFGPREGIRPAGRRSHCDRNPNATNVTDGPLPPSSRSFVSGRSTPLTNQRSWRPLRQQQHLAYTCGSSRVHNNNNNNSTCDEIFRSVFSIFECTFGVRGRRFRGRYTRSRHVNTPSSVRKALASAECCANVDRRLVIETTVAAATAVVVAAVALRSAGNAVSGWSFEIGRNVVGCRAVVVLTVVNRAPIG